MRPCFNEATTMKSAGLEQDLKLCAEAGFKDMELREEKFVRFLRAGHSVRDVKALFEHYGIKPACFNALKGFSFCHGSGGANLRALTNMYCAALAEIGVPNLELIAAVDMPGLSEQEIHDETVKAISRIGDIAADYGIRLALEYMGLPNHTVRTFKQALAITRDSDRKNVGLLVDTWHHYMSGSTAEEITPDTGDKLFVVHISDAPKAEPFTLPRSACVMPGDGVLPNEKLLKALKRAGYDDFVSLEVFDPAVQEMPAQEAIRTAYAKTVQAIKSAESE